MAAMMQQVLHQAMTVLCSQLCLHVHSSSPCVRDPWSWTAQADVVRLTPQQLLPLVFGPNTTPLLPDCAGSTRCFEL